MNKSSDALKRKFEFSKREFVDYLHIKKLAKGSTTSNKIPFANSKKQQICFKTFKTTLPKDFNTMLNDYMDTLTNTESLLDKGKVATVLQEKNNVEKNMSKSESMVSSHFNLLTKAWESKNNIIGNGLNRFNKIVEDKFTFKFEEFDVDDFYENYKGSEGDRSQLYQTIKYYVTEREQIRNKIIALENGNTSKEKPGNSKNINKSNPESTNQLTRKRLSSKRTIRSSVTMKKPEHKQAMAQGSQALKNQSKGKSSFFDIELTNQAKEAGKISLTDTEKKLKKDKEEEVEFYNVLIEEKDSRLKYIADRMAALHIDVYEILSSLQESDLKP